MENNVKPIILAYYYDTPKELCDILYIVYRDSKYYNDISIDLVCSVNCGNISTEGDLVGETHKARTLQVTHWSKP